MSSKNCIKVYARLKPDKTKQILKYNIIRNTTIHEILFTLPDHCSDISRYGGNKFRFHQILNETIEQAKVFETVVKPVIDNVLDGYNGTILAYGQTGSGKTFTMTGSTEDYDNRGVIPRSIQYIFEVIRKSPDTLFSVYISYLEIYNEFGYDLLDQRDASKLEDLQKVTAMEDTNGNMHLRNLSVMPVTAETDALQLLFMGDTNRTIAETPMNPFSTRSHCIFTIHIGTRKPNSKTVRRGKLHLVDLAGSERLAKTSQSVTKTINEAKHINLSLHYLEQVIVALAESRRQHIPYRNSLLTSVLRDSLGGNCLTSMIATLSLKSSNFLETISTCRFAERVALINNEVKVNEDYDPQMEVATLKSEIELLRNQLSIYTKNDVTKKLSETQEQKCKEAVQKFIQGLTVDLEIEPNYQSIRYCFQLLKNMIVTENLHRKMLTNSSKHKRDSAGGSTSSSNDTDSLENCKQLIKQRDSEISILINLLRKEKDKTMSVTTSTNNVICASPRPGMTCYAPTNKPENTVEPPTPPSDEFHQVESILSSPRCLFSEEYQFTATEKAAYETFINNPDNVREVKNCRALLREKLSTARKLASVIELIKSKILTIQKEFKTVNENSNSLKMMVHLKQRLTDQRCIYKEKMVVLRDLKTETDHIRNILENLNTRLMRRFKEWYKTETLQKIPCRETSADLQKQPPESPEKNTPAPKIPESIFSKDSQIKNIEEHLNRENRSEPAIDNKVYSWEEFIKTEPIFKDVDEQSTSSFIYDDGETVGQNMNMSTDRKSPRNRAPHLESSDTMIDIRSDILSATSCSDNEELVDDFEVIYKNPNVRKTTPEKLGELPKISVEEHEIRPSTSKGQIGSNKTWDEFVKTLPLTGDAEVDTEIINFYKGSFGIK